MTATDEIAKGPPCPSATLFDQLADASPAERSTILLRLLEDRQALALDLSLRDGRRACLDGVDLSRASLEARLAEAGEPPSWWDNDQRRLRLVGANLRGASLRLADLREADLNGADLSGALAGDARLCGTLLEQASLRDADLAGADLSDAVLGEASFQGAMLEDATFRRASLRYAHLQDAVLENATFEHADLWGANLRNAALGRADLRGATLEEADLRGAHLSGANLQEANLRGANLEDTVLQGARLQGMNLTECNIRHVSLARAWLSKTEMRREQLGEAVGEEMAGDYRGAEQAYLALERNFAEIGDVDASSWAYRRKRRMQKKAALREAHQACRRGSWRAAMGGYSAFAIHRFVEWLCDYGESTAKVVRATLCVYVLFTLAYFFGGLLVRAEEGEQGTHLIPSYDIFEIAVYSVLAMSTAGYADIGLQPRNILTHLLAGLQGISLMVLAGLFGFVFANKIRR